MNDIKNVLSSENMRGGFYLKAGWLPMALGLAMLGGSPSAIAANECGPGPTVTCVGPYTSGISYDFASDFSMTVNGAGTIVTGEVRVGGAAQGLRLTGTGNAGVNLTTNGRITQAGGVHVNLDSGNLEADIRNSILDGTIASDSAIGTGLRISTAGSANLRLHGNRAAGNTTFRLSNLVMDVGSDSRVWVDFRRSLASMTLSPRAGATLRLDNDAGIIGNTLLDRIGTEVVIKGAGAGSLEINNALQRGRINGVMDFTGMTGSLTLFNDYSGNPRQGGWHTTGTSLFGSGEVVIRNGQYGALRTALDTALDFSSTRDAQFVNEGRVMVGATDNLTPAGATHSLTFIGVDRFENAGLILLGTAFGGVSDQGTESNGNIRDRLVFQDSHYAGAGGAIALDTLLGSAGQVNCNATTVSDCVQFTGNSSTEGLTLLQVRDANPQRDLAGFNPGIVIVDGSSAAEHFALHPDSQFYVSNTSGGAALQKGMVVYRLEYDAATRQHALVGTLADEPVQASTLGAAAHESWRASTDTWFDRQASLRNGVDDGFGPRSLWVATNTSRGDRSLQRSVNVAGSPTVYNLSQDQDVSHVAFGLDLLRIHSGAQRWSGGVTFGLLYSTVDYEATRTQAEMSGMSGGLYASWALSDLTVDALFNANYLRQSVDASHFGLGQHNELRSQVKSSGGRIEAAWKLALSEGLWLQPLASVSLVDTSEGDLSLPDGSGGVRFGNDDRSIRVGGGMRLGADGSLAGLRAQYRLTGRVWNEREARNTVVVDVASEPQPIAVVDDFGGNFNELDGSLALSNDSGSLSGYVGVKHKFAEDYSSFGGSAGLRYSW